MRYDVTFQAEAFYFRPDYGREPLPVQLEQYVVQGWIHCSFWGSELHRLRGSPVELVPPCAERGIYSASGWMQADSGYSRHPDRLLFEWQGEGIFQTGTSAEGSAKARPNEL